MKSLLLLAALFLISFKINAVSTTSDNKIKQVHFWEGVPGVLIIHADMSKTEGCTRTDQYILREAHPFFKELYSLLLSAHISGQHVRLGLKNCYSSFPSIVNIYSNK